MPSNIKELLDKLTHELNRIKVDYFYKKYKNRTEISQRLDNLLTKLSGLPVRYISDFKTTVTIFRRLESV